MYKFPMAGVVYVIGGGSVGVFLAARLSLVLPVTLVVREGRGEAYRKGIDVLSAADGRVLCEARLPVVEWSQLQRMGAGSWLFWTPKVHDLRDALRAARGRLNGSETHVFCQNGLGVLEDARECLAGAQRLARAVLWLGVRRLGSEELRTAGDPARVRVVQAGVSLSEIASDSAATNEELGRWVRFLEAAGIPSARATGGVRAVEWRKAYWNAAWNAPLALAGQANEAVFSDPAIGDRVRKLMLEVARVAEAEGVELGPKDERRVWESGRQVAANRCSMVQDLDAGRRTEIEWLNGAVVRLARAHGIAVPENERVLAAIREREARVGKAPDAAV